MTKTANYWNKFCKPCNKFCCKQGPVMIYNREYKKICAASTLEKHFTKCEGYYLLTGKPCPFLKGNGKCEIHKIKPLDCIAYPIFIKQTEAGLEWRIDPNCPAHKSIPKHFVKQVQKIFLKIKPELRRIDWLIASRQAKFKTKKLT